MSTSAPSRKLSIDDIEDTRAYERVRERFRAEMIALRSGLGYLIFSYGGVGADDAMLAVVLYLAILGYLLDRLYLVGLRRAMSWHAFAH